MWKKLESWLLNVFVGKLVARAAVTVAGFLASAAVQGPLSQVGISVQIDEATLVAGMITLAHGAFEWFKKRRMANPNSPAVQTDPNEPGGTIPATQAVIQR